MQPSITTPRRSSNCSDRTAKTFSNPAIPAQDKESRAEFARSAHEKLQIEQDPTNPDRVTFAVGNRTGRFPCRWFARTENGASTQSAEGWRSSPAGSAETN
jgi:hypothetical protein